jgi:hypothetical protein
MLVAVGNSIKNESLQIIIEELRCGIRAMKNGRSSGPE